MGSRYHCNNWSFAKNHYFPVIFNQNWDGAVKVILIFPALYSICDPKTFQDLYSELLKKLVQYRHLREVLRAMIIWLLKVEIAECYYQTRSQDCKVTSLWHREILFLPIAREGNVFTGDCHSVHNWPHAYSVTTHPCWLLGHLLRCGRYASYWNAYL